MLPTASSVERAMVCVASTILEEGPDETNPSRERGILIHKVIAATLRGWEMPNVGRYKLKINFDELRAFLGTGDLRCELAFGYDPISRLCKTYGENIGRDYPEDGLQHGTLDIALIRRNALLMDVKTGSHRATPVEDNWQMRTLAAMLMHAYPEIESIMACLAYLDRDGSWNFDDRCQWSGFDISDFADDLEAMHPQWTQTTNPRPTPRADACKWCRCVCDARIVEAA